ncbi:MAG: SprB repeat-containing protein [Flavobacteriales bacterium]|nr:MAG: SprB repeat-containing protein [Flavobacteriales bacterium]
MNRAFLRLITASLAFAPFLANAISVSATLVNPSACGAPTGAIVIQVWGGTPPYTFAWSNGATTSNIYNLLPGNYSVTVTDANSDQATGAWDVGVSILAPAPNAQDGHCSCNGSMSGQVQIIEWGIGGTPPYTYNPPPDGFDPQGDPYFVYFGMPAGTTVAIEVTDANGCAGISYQTILGPMPPGGPSMQVLSTSGSCTGTSGGSVTIGNVSDPQFFLNPSPQLTVLDQAQQFVTSLAQAGSTATINGLAPGNYTVVRDWDPTDYLMAYNCDGNPYDVLAFTIADLGNNCGSLSGSVFIDNSDDCVQDPAEVGVPYQVLAIEPGGLLAITDGDGAFARDLPSGNYTLAQTDPTLVQQCPVAAPVPFTMGTVPIEIHLADSSTVPLDLSAQLQSSAMRPGFAGNYWGWVRNLSPQVSGAVTVTLSIDADLIYTGAAPPPTTVLGNTLTWDLPPFTALQVLPITVNVAVPAGTTLGTPVSTGLSVVNTLNDGNAFNNTATSSTVVTGSYDPNDKTAITSSGWSQELYYIDQDEWIDYLIRFQNTGTDTAFTVVVTDTLSEELDMASFQQGVASHAFHVAFKPGRVVEWTFPNILLPDSNVNEAASHGAVSFRIKPVLPLLAGTTIENIANIYFDFNPPVITEPSVLVAEFSTGVVQRDGGTRLQLFPNPARDAVTISAGKERIVRWMVTASDSRLVLSGSSDGVMAMIDLDGLAPGTYCIHAESGSGTRLQASLIKQ